MRCTRIVALSNSVQSAREGNCVLGVKCYGVHASTRNQRGTMTYIGAGTLFWGVAALLAGSTVRRFRPTRVDLPYMSLLVYLVFFGMFMALLPSLNYTLVVDDAYYFMRIAQNIVETGSPTFDGIHRTNGFNPLWLCMLAALQYAVPVGREGFVSVVQLSAIVLMALSALQLHRLTSRFMGPLARVVVLLVWANPWAFYRYWMGSMETPALTFFMLVLLNMTLELPPIGKRGWLHHAGLGALGGLVMLARPDSAILVGAVLVLLLTLEPQPLSARLRVAVEFGLAAALPVVGWLIHNLLYFGHISSISAHVKLFVYHGSLALRYDLFCLPLSSLGNMGLLPIMRFAMPVLMVAGGWASWRVIRTNPDRRTRWFLAMLFLAAAAHYVLTKLTVTHAFSWYFALETVATAILCGCIIDLVANRRGLPLRLAKAATVLATCCSALLLADYLSADQQTFMSKKIIEDNRAACDWLNEHAPEGTIVGSWDAGLFGYFSHHRVIPLDGLVNDWDYLDVISSGSYVDYARQENIEYIANGFYLWNGQPSANRLGLDQLTPLMVEAYRGPVRPIFKSEMAFYVFSLEGAHAPSGPGAVERAAGRPKIR